MLGRGKVLEWKLYGHHYEVDKGMEPPKLCYRPGVRPVNSSENCLSKGRKHSSDGQGTALEDYEEG